MKTFALYKNGKAIDQMQVYGNDSATPPDGWVEVQGSAYTLDDVIRMKSEAISTHAKALRDKAVGGISAGEMASWPIKLSEAATFAQTGLDSDAPMLTAEATARGLTTAELVAKVGDNAVGFAALEANISGVDGKHRDAIKALATVEDVNSYDYSTGWPEV